MDIMELTVTVLIIMRFHSSVYNGRLLLLKKSASGFIIISHKIKRDKKTVTSKLLPTSRAFASTSVLHICLWVIIEGHTQHTKLCTMFISLKV
jgi:hypothetical protein